ncbi:hypothetical protein AGRA3207_003324 [Actinomadura graeca]|uniref:Uncharacterized protein n=1 Tax=Actinomadura graeca TaxID=2750812 RepID=A0ABX8QUM3_9ACTN|nr:hypothetical protein [Actinomadura graeca]QXJ22338.1 hypothetical protein AGRA3207_003324 [Actinomadura graeca]
MRTLLAAALAVPPLSLAAPGPAVEIDRAEARVGDTVTVDLAAWPSGNVLIELCGNGGTRGSADCAVAAAATTFVDAKGRGTAMVTVVRPPIGCPCVISVRPVAGGRARTVPLAVKGVPSLSSAQRRAVSAAPVRDLAVSGIRVTGGGPWPAWLGGPATRTVTFTVRNTGAAPVTDPPLTLAAGRGAEPTGILDAPKIGTLAPGQERTFSVRARLPGPAFGRYTVAGELTGVDRPARFTARTSSYPWALPALIVLAAPLAAVREFRRPRGRAGRGPAAPPRAVAMNEIVALNVGQWRRLRNLSRSALAEALTPLTGAAWTDRDVERAETFVPPRRFDADELLALSRALDVPLPALLLPPSGYEIAPPAAPVVGSGRAPAAGPSA